jgi:putative membrane protein
VDFDVDGSRLRNLSGKNHIGTEVATASAGNSPEGDVQMSKYLLAIGVIAMVCLMALSAKVKAGDDNKLAASDAKFVTEAATGGMMEVQLGQAVADKTTNDEVKQFAQRMVTDHTNANNELKALAQQKNVTIPNELDPKHQKTMEKITAKTGTDLDKAYMQAMVKDHKKDVSEFQKAANDAKDADVKAFAAKTLPVLQEHLTMAQNLNKSLGGKEDTDDAKHAGHTEGGAQNKDKEKDKGGD